MTSKDNNKMIIELLQLYRNLDTFVKEDKINDITNYTIKAIFYYNYKEFIYDIDKQTKAFTKIKRYKNRTELIIKRISYKSIDIYNQNQDEYLVIGSNETYIFYELYAYYDYVFTQCTREINQTLHQTKYIIDEQTFDIFIK